MADKKRSTSKPAAKPAGAKPAGGVTRQQPLNRTIEAPPKSKTPLFITIGVAVVAVVALVLILTSGSNKNGSASSSSTVPGLTGDAIVSSIAAIPTATFDSAGPGDAQTVFKKISSEAITKDGKPEVLFIGAEFCPFCAAERWAMTAALSRFGTFSNVGLMRSADNDGNLATVTFHGASYKSDYFTLTALESVDRASKPLDKPTDAQTKLWLAINGQQSWPFLDVGGKYALSTTYLNVHSGIIDGFSQSEIASLMADPATPVGKTIIGAANQFSAAICSLTNNQPASVCDSAGVKAAIAALPAK
jgi:Domain of unknown function (DUF929)